MKQHVLDGKYVYQYMCFSSGLALQLAGIQLTNEAERAAIIEVYIFMGMYTTHV